jgi:hypothetical protein
MFDLTQKSMVFNWQKHESAQGRRPHHEAKDLPVVRRAVVVHKMSDLPLVPPRF